MSHFRDTVFEILNYSFIKINNIVQYVSNQVEEISSGLFFTQKIDIYYVARQKMSCFKKTRKALQLYMLYALNVFGS